MSRPRMLALTVTALATTGLAACSTTAQMTVQDTPEWHTVPDRHTVYVSDDAFSLVEDRLRAGIEARPLTLFTVVDHGAGARDVGTPIGESKLFLVGNPEVGTPFMVADPQLGLDLPLKILIHDTEDGTHLAYSHPGEAAERHGVRAELTPQIDRIHAVMEALLSEAAGDTVRVINAR